MSRLRSSTVLSVVTALTIAPRVAHATDMSGLAVILVGMVVGVPALLVLVVLLGVAIAAAARTERAPWHRTYGTVLTIAAPLLALAYPLTMLLMGGKSDFVVVALMFDAPALIVAVIAVVFARRLQQ